MNLQTHIVSAGAGAFLVAQYVDTTSALGFFGCAAFFDVDHYLLYWWKFRDLNLRKAIDYFNANKHRGRFCLCFLHTVEVIGLFGWIAYGADSVFLYACWSGLIFHFLIDFFQALYHRRLHYRWWSLVQYGLAKDRGER